MNRKYTFYCYILLVFCYIGMVSCHPTKYYTQEYLDYLDYRESQKEQQEQRALDQQKKEREASLKLKEEHKKEKEAIQKEKEKRKKEKKRLKEELRTKKQIEKKRIEDSIALSKNPKEKKKADTLASTTPTTNQQKANDTAKSTPSPSTPAPQPPKPVLVKKTLKEATKNASDTVERKEFILSKQSIKDIVNQEAKDYAFMDGDGNIRLVGSTVNRLKNMDLKSDTVLYNATRSIMTVIPQKDSLDNLMKRINFSQSSKTFQMDEMIFNPITRKALYKNLQTKEGDLFIHSSRVKQENDSTFYGENGIFSTCEYFPPHFSFRTRKFKMVRGRNIITGSLYANFEGVPLPPKIFILPFAMLPIPKTRTSGIQIPTLITDGINGFGLENFGYYLAPSPYFDVKLMGSYFAKGLYRGSTESNYLKKYKFRGNTYFDYQYKENGRSGDADYSVEKNYNIRTSFNLDPKVDPSITFGFNINIVNNANYNVNAVQLTPIERLNNTYSSSISFSKTWNRGIFQRITTNMNHSQNTNTKIIDLTFPDINLQTFSINPISLFSNTSLSSGHWYDKLRLQYSLRFTNRTQLTENNFNIGNILDSARWSATQSFPIQLTLPKLGPITITPNITFGQDLTDMSTATGYSIGERRSDTIIKRGVFVKDNNLSTGLGFNLDDIIGMLQFSEKSTIKAFRHIIRLSGSFSYKPDFSTGNYYKTIRDSLGNVEQRGYFGGVYTKQESANISFNITNVFQAKWKKRKAKGDTTTNEDIKKADLLNVGISNAYNLIADSFNLGNFSINYTTNISEKISLSGAATLDPYRYEEGNRTKYLAWGEKGQFGIGKISSFTLSFNLSFSGDKKNNNNPSPLEKQHSNERRLPSSYPGESYDVLNQTRDLIQRNQNAFVDFNIPWTLRMGINTSHTRGSYNKASGDFDYKTAVSNSFSGDISLTKKWKIGFNGIWDMVEANITTMGLTLSRDLHCWQMNITVNPIGSYKSFGFTIQPKSQVLRDLKINQTRSLF